MLKDCFEYLLQHNECNIQEGKKINVRDSAVRNTDFIFEIKRYEIPSKFLNSIQNSKLNIIINFYDYSLQ